MCLQTCIRSVLTYYFCKAVFIASLRKLVDFEEKKQEERKGREGDERERVTHPPLALAKKFFVPSYLCSSNTRDRLKLAGLLESAGGNSL